MKNTEKMKKNTVTKFSGPSLPYVQAAMCRTIESPIARLVDVLNLKDVCGTRASCAGHGWPWILQQRPYVYFVCDLPWSLKLSQLVDELIASKQLAHYWVIEGRHVADIGLCWTLKLSDSRSFIKRSLINQDFETLAQCIRLLGSEFQKGVILGEDGIGKDAKNSQNHNDSESLGFADFSKGIGIQAFGAVGR